MSGFLNLGSLLLGLTAWIAPILAIKHSGKRAVNNCFRFIIVSFSACVASLCLQLFEINHRVQIRDWAALMDTIVTLVWAALVLAVTTLILNITVLGICSKKETKV